MDANVLNGTFDSDSEVEFRLEKRDYDLNQCKTENKQHVVTERQEEIVITNTDGGTTLKLNSVLFNELKDRALVYFTADDRQYKCLHTSVTDTKGNIVESKFKISQGKTHLYTLNLYHTKCSALVNGRSTNRFIDTDLPKILDWIQSDICTNSGPISVTSPEHSDSEQTAVKSVDISTTEHADTGLDNSIVCDKSVVTILRQLQSDLLAMQTLLQTHIINTNNQFDILKDEVKSIKSASLVHSQSTSQQIEYVQQTSQLISSELRKSSDILQRRLQSISDSLKSQNMTKTSETKISSVSNSTLEHECTTPVFTESPINTAVSSNSSHNPIARDTLIIGDSILKGINIRGLDGTVRVKTLPGAQTGDILQHLRSSDLSKYANVVLHVGGNDVASGKPHAALRANFKEITSYLRESSCSTYLCSICPRRDVDVRGANSIIEEICQIDNVSFIDNYNSFVFGNGTMVRDNYLRDEIHLQARGTRVLLQNINSSVCILPKRDSDQRDSTFHYQRRRSFHGNYNQHGQYHYRQSNFHRF